MENSFFNPSRVNEYLNAKKMEAQKVMKTPTIVLRKSGWSRRLKTRSILVKWIY